jgi:1-acyl-sn-glycerol-3-phosphate acyltransferase
MSHASTVAGWILRRWGWTITGERPAVPRYIVIASPHSSYWDMPVMVLFAVHFGIRLRWVGKSEAFRGPLDPVMRWMGGIPIDRRGGNGVVAATAALFSAQDELALAIAPDGVRRYCDYWRSGFYYVARTADVPVVLTYLDWGSRRAGIGPTLRLTGDVTADMGTIRTFYAGMTARHAAWTSRVRLREEDAPRAESPAAPPR